MRVLDTAFAKGFIRVCDDGFNQNWHERDGSNLSYRTKHKEVGSVKEELSYDGKQQPIGTSVPALAEEHFMVSGNGRFMCSMILESEPNYCIIEMNQAGENYHICWGLAEGGRPASKLPTHLMDHEVKMRATEGRYRVVYRAHLASIVALTFVLPLVDEVFTRELWEMATECPVVFPSGVGVVGWVVPGGRDVAVATNELMKEYNTVIWAHHGLFYAGESSDLTFGLMRTIEKSAEILVRVLGIHPDKLRAIAPQDFRNLAVDFHMNLSEKFLCEKWEERRKSGGLRRQYKDREKRKRSAIEGHAFSFDVWKESYKVVTNL